MKILLVEDQELPLRYMSEVLDQLGAHVDVAKWYSQAEEFIRSGCDYDVVLLDHRMPRNDPGCTDDSNFDHFCDQLENVGYGLVPLIREYLPKTVIVGTSSLTPSEILSTGFAPLDMRIDKTNPWDEIPRVLKEIRR